MSEMSDQHPVNTVHGDPGDDWLADSREVVITPDSWTQDFFAALAEGTRVSLAPGKYRGSVTLTKGIHLGSQDSKNPGVIFAAEAPDDRKTHALTVTSKTPGTLTNLTFRGENFANQTLLTLGEGQWEVTGCQFRGAYEVAVAVTGPGAGPLVQRCTIHGGATGILVEKGSRGTFDDNEILDHIKNTLVVRDPETAPLFKNNKVHDGQQCGLHISAGAGGTYEDNDIFGNFLSNVLVKDPGTNPVFRTNRVRDGKRGGFFIQEGAGGTYEGNEVTGNSATSVEIKDPQTSPTFVKNKIFSGRQGGVSIYAGAGGKYEENEIGGHGLANVFVFQPGTNPFFRKNKIHTGGHAGISIYGTASGTFEDNDIYGNAQANVIVVHAGTNPTFHGNKVHNGKQGGIFIHGGASGTYLENEVNDNAMANIEVLDPGTNPVFKGNQIHSCLNEGLFIQNGAKGKFELNEFKSNGFSTKGLEKSGPGYPSIRIVGRKTSPTFLSNTIIGFASAAVEISKGASGYFERNTIRDLDVDNQFVFDKKWAIHLGSSAKRKDNFDN